MKNRKLFCVLTLLILCVVALTSCGSSDGDSSTTLVSIAVTPGSPSVAKGATQQFTAIGNYSDGAAKDITTSATWRSSDVGVATINTAGLATSIIGGRATIRASLENVSGSAVLTVAAAPLASITVMPTNRSIAQGTKQQFIAIGTLSDNSTQDITTQVTWSSSDANVATISNNAGANGIATPVAAGTATITAASGEISANTTVTVTTATLASLAVTPGGQSIEIGTPVQFTATGTFSDSNTQDLTSQVAWSSSNTTVANINQAGQPATYAAGSTTITATSSLGGGISGNATLHVNIALPKTGQTTCYDASGSVISCTDTGQDGELQKGITWPSTRFTTNADTTITDNLTGFVWAPDAGTPTFGACAGGAKTWQGALDYVACLNSNNYLGYNDWRLPNINELESLVNAEVPDISEWLNVQGFSNVVNIAQYSYYWSSTTHATPAYARMVSLTVGIVFVAHKSATDKNVLPVRAGYGTYTAPADLPKTGQTICYDASGNVISCANTGQDGEFQKGVAWPGQRFTNLDNTTPITGNVVLDQLTGLIWARDAGAPTVGTCAGGWMPWQGALNYVACLNTNNYLGHNDWRLPNRGELGSLINYGETYNYSWLNAQGFSNVAPSSYWMSTTYTSLPDYACDINMSDATMLAFIKNGGRYVWPVRGGL